MISGSNEGVELNKGTDGRPDNNWSVEQNGNELVIEFDRTTHEIIWEWESETRVHFRIVKRRRGE